MSDFNRRKHARAPRSKTRFLVATMVIAALLAGVGYLNRSSVRGLFENIAGKEFSGIGEKSKKFTIAKGDTGEIVAKHLAEYGFTKDFTTTLRNIVAKDPTFFPGTYLLPIQISSDTAIAYLTDESKQIVNKVTIPEGLRVKDIFAKLSKSTGIAVSEFISAGNNLAKFDLPKSAISLEGYLFPATYNFSEGMSAEQILSTMVERMKQELAVFGVPKKDWSRTITLASIIQREARLHDDFYKVSRVFQNRLAINMPLQSCATASYGVGNFSIIVTNKILNDDNPYNTYKYSGLPVGPISAPGSLAIDAALHPATGSWLYFVTWNLSTGETIFSDTYAEHLKGVAKWDAWMSENPGWNG